LILPMTGSVQLLYTVLPNGSLVYGESDKPEIYLYKYGKIKKIIKENFERKRLSEEELKINQERAEKILEFSKMKVNIPVYDFYPSFSSLSSDEKNQIWIQFRKTDADYLYGYTEEGKNFATYKLQYPPNGIDKTPYIQVMGGIAFYREFDREKGIRVLKAILK
ncbi:MAG: hypothetical protein JW737_09525, partial [Acidobacteria bacterium]|nr:hypothetical protein [Acidobacteriota bacterium]